MRRSCATYLLASLLGLAGLGAGGSAVAVVLVVSSERSGAYQQAADALVSEMNQGGGVGASVVQATLAELPNRLGDTPRLFIALGVESCATLARSRRETPLLCSLLPRASYERILNENGRRSGAQLSALYLNQPLTRQLDLLRLALPRVQRVGVLWGGESRQHESELLAAAQRRGLQIRGVALRQDEPVYNGLKKVLDDSEVLLALADPQIYNRSSIQNILLTSFRAQVPMQAFSPSYVRAGALLAVYSTPQQIGKQTARMAKSMLQSQSLPPPQYPQEFEVDVNEHVARSLGLNLDERTLSDQLRRKERD